MAVYLSRQSHRMRVYNRTIHLSPPSLSQSSVKQTDMYLSAVGTLYLGANELKKDVRNI